MSVLNPSMNTNCIFNYLAAVCIVSTLSALADQSTNSMAPKADPNIIWGPETNGISAGLYVEHTPITVTTSFDPLLYNSRTNMGNIYGSMWLHVPPSNSRYQVFLTDIKSNAVPKTAKGSALGAPLTEPLRGRKDGAILGINYPAGFGSFTLDARVIHPQPSGTFALRDYFKIEQSGRYHLCFISYLYLPKGDDDVLVQLPPVDLDIDVKVDPP